MDLYTKSILTVLAIAVLLNASNPLSMPISKWAEFRSRVARIESELSTISSSIIVVAVLLNGMNPMNPWIKPIVALAKSHNSADGSEPGVGQL